MKVLLLSFLLAFCAIIASANNAVPFKKPITSKVPTVKLGNSEYYFVFDELASWYDAMEFCEMEGLQLVTIETPEENELLKQYIKDQGKDNFFVYTAGTSIGRDSWDSFYWATTGNDYTFTDWLPTEGYDAGENCMVFYWNRWLHSKCSEPARFICEIVSK